MRRRPSGSGSGDDDHQDESLSSSAVEKKLDAGREVTTKDAALRLAKPSSRSQERRLPSGRRQSNAVSTSEPALTWPSSTTVASAHQEQPIDDPAPPKEAADVMSEHQRRRLVRLRAPWRCSLLTLATSISAIVLLMTIVHAFLHRQQDPKGCAMSYMMPAFARFSDFDTEHTRFASKYSLYLYREGGVDEDTRVKGIPVLFIPGNAGSYKQVRPIAAEAAHYFQDVLRQDAAVVAEGKRSLDFFTVDFNEELTAFHGQTLLDQAEYLNEAVAYILALYHNPNRSLRESGLPDPKSVIVIGHSMGGIVARAMLRMPNYQESSINTIVTLATPHARHPISFDAKMVATYNDINTFWRESYLQLSAGKNPLSDVTLVSVAGGGLDTMVPSEYASLTSLVPETHGFTVFTSGIPNVWTGMDHLAIMWCDQLRKALVKALYDVVDVRRPAQTRTQDDRIRAFRKRLLTGMEAIVQNDRPDRESLTHLTLDLSSTNVLPQGQRLALRSLGGTATGVVHLMRIPTHLSVDGDKFTLLTDQMLHENKEDGTLSVLLCSLTPAASSGSAVADVMAHARASIATRSTKLVCKTAAPDVVLLPASTNESVNAFDNARPFSYLQYDRVTLAEYQYVAVIDRATEPTQGWAIAEFNNGSESSMKVSKGHHQLLMRGLKLTLPSNRPMMMEMKIPEVHSTLFAYQLEVQRHPCDHFEESFTPLLRQNIAEPYESKFFVNTKGGNINVHGLSPYMPPPLRGGGVTDGLTLQLWTDPVCNSTVEISLKVDKLGSAGKLVMRYRIVFAAFPLLVVALVLRKQFKVYDSTGVFMSFTQSMDQCIRTSLPAIFVALTFFAIAVSKSGQHVWTRNWLKSSTNTSEHTVDFTINDLMLGTSDPFFWFLVPLFALISVGICIAANYVVLTLIHVFAAIYSRVIAWTQRSVDGQSPVTSQGTATVNQRIITTGVLILMVITVIPYQFAYIVLCIVQIVTCVRALKAAQDSQSTESYNFYNYTHSILVMMLWILPINMPVLVVWMHNLAAHWLTPFSTHHNLLSVIGYILLVETMSMHNMIPRVTGRTRHITNTLIFGLALYAAVYGVTYAYRMHYLFNALCLWFFVLHLSNSPVSLASMAHHLPGRSPGDSKVKKRP